MRNSNFFKSRKNGNNINDFDILIGVNYIHYLNVFDSVVNFKSSIFWMIILNYRRIHGRLYNKQQSDRLFEKLKMFHGLYKYNGISVNRVKKQLVFVKIKLLLDLTVWIINIHFEHKQEKIMNDYISFIKE